jgi:undecaprenyl pyrophosphate phosphatase UppP
MAEGIILAFGALLAITIYFVPTLVAFNKEHRQKIAILALNICLGWTLLGWVGALVWSLIRDEHDDSRF